MIDTDGFAIFAADARVSRWAAAARVVARDVAQRADMRSADNLRHQQTWFVGVDALPNGRDGSLEGTPLHGPWQAFVPELPLHPAQVSIIYAGYPKQDADESDANHGFRLNRAAAHVDGLLPVGPHKRRFALEYHAYILALPLNDVTASPTVVWRGSHRIMQRALRDTIADGDPAQVDITEAYKAARREVFETCEQIPLRITAGQSALVHRFALHGTQPWDRSDDPSGEGRMVAFFRPECAGGAAQWLALP